MMKKTVFLLITAGLIVFLAVGIKEKKKETAAVLPSTESICAYLMSYGWETDTDRMTSEDIIIPYEFSDVYTEYNSIQKRQGFDLSAHRGNEAVLITCPVTNYSSQNDVYAELILEDTRLIGADLICYGENGFITPLNSR